MTDKLSDLEICKRSAEEKGMTTHQVGNIECAENLYARLPAINEMHTGSFPYNPITDNSLNLELRDEYDVEVSYINGTVSIYGHDYAIGRSWQSLFTCKSEINRAVCLCILESVK